MDDIFDEQPVQGCRYPPCTIPLDEDDAAWLEIFGEWDQKELKEKEGCEQRGAYDPQLESFTPCFTYGKEDSRYRVQVPSWADHPAGSPVRHLLCNTEKADAVARCVFRLRSMNPSTAAVGGEFSSGHALAPVIMGVAMHATPGLDEDRKRSSFVLTDIYPSFSTCFRRPFAAFLTWGSTCPDTNTVMTDPLSNIPWTPAEGKTCDGDMEFVRIDENHGRQKVHSFKRFLLPVSLTWYHGEVTSLSCGIVGFPMVTEEREKLNSANGANSICRKYRHALKEELRKTITRNYGEVPKKMDKETKAFFRDAINEALLSHTRHLFDDCFGRLRTGDLICSVGKIVAANETTLAANYSSLPGCSGGPVFCPEFPRGTYVGIQAGGANAMQDKTGALVYPNHNVATSTDNPAYVLSYFRDVLPELPVRVRQEEERAEAFRHYLLKHLGLLVRTFPELSPVQLEWLRWVVSGSPPESTARVLFGDQPGLCYKRTRLLEVAEQLIKLSIDAGFPVTKQELEAILCDETRARMFMVGIELELLRQGLDIAPWGLPARVNNVCMLCYLSNNL